MTDEETAPQEEARPVRRAPESRAQRRARRAELEKLMWQFAELIHKGCEEATGDGINLWQLLEDVQTLASEGSKMKAVALMAQDAPGMETEATIARTAAIGAVLNILAASLAHVDQLPIEYLREMRVAGMAPADQAVGAAIAKPAEAS